MTLILYSQALPCAAFLFVIYKLISSLLLLRKRRHRAYVAGCLPPPILEQKDSILGFDTLANSFHAVQDHEYLKLSKQRFEETGKTFQFQQLGTTVVNTIEPRNIQSILSTKFQDYSVGNGRAGAWHPLLGQGILTVDGPAWTQYRRMLRPSFTELTRDDLSILEPHVDHMLSQLETALDCVDLQGPFKELTTAIAGGLILGRTGEDTSSSRRETSRFSNAFSRAQKAVAKYQPLGSLSNICLKSGKQFRQDRKIVQTYMDKHLETGLKREASRSRSPSPSALPSAPSIASNLAQQIQDPTLLRSALSHLILAGRDTVADTISNLWFILARRPDIYSRIRAEILLSTDTATSKNNLSPQFVPPLSTLPYTQATIKETLRLFPPIPVNYRTAIVDTILPLGGGPYGTAPIFVTKGTRVGYHVYTMHRDESIYGADAEDFNPDRWIDDDGLPQAGAGSVKMEDAEESTTGRTKLRPGWGYLPFNGGPRACLGQQLAWRIVGYVTVRLVREFEAVVAVDQDGADVDDNTDFRETQNAATPATTSRPSALKGTTITSGRRAEDEWIEDVGLTYTNAAGCWVRVTKAKPQAQTQAEMGLTTTTNCDEEQNDQTQGMMRDEGRQTEPLA